MSVVAVIERLDGLSEKAMDAARLHPKVLQVDGEEPLGGGLFRRMRAKVATSHDADNIFGKVGAMSPWGTRTE